MTCFRNWFIIFLLFLLNGFWGFAQKPGQTDSLVVLMSSKSARTVDIEGASYREVVGPARFLHNNTYLICDTALWNVETKVIDAWGNVSIIQEETVLKSDKLTYLIDSDLAQFRGTLVQLEDKDHNTLRTRHLDYNTKDSLAVFRKGGSMRDKDGQIIESNTGTYDSKLKKFIFSEDVNMFTDSVFIKTDNLVYESEKNLATFGINTNAWQEDNMLSSNRGWYNREDEVFFFSDDVHVMSTDQEGWCDSLYFYRNTSDVEMLGKAQVTDTTRNVFALAGRIHYLDSLSRVTLTRKPAVITETESPEGVKDTIYLGAESLVYYTVPMFQVDSAAKVDAAKRLEVLDVDPVGSFRKKAAEEAAKAAEEAAKNDPNYRPQQPPKQQPPKQQPPKPQPPKQQAPKQQPPFLGGQAGHQTDSLSRSLDTLALGDSLALADSLAVNDSLALKAEEPPKDSTAVGFLEAMKNVKIYRKDIQIVCDSLLYCDLDSLARLYVEPVIWQDSVRQYSADSISVAVRAGGIDKASLMSEAFIAIQEDTSHYNQIKATEMLAYFDDKGELVRFDALGGASAVFFIEENDELATVNKTDSKMMSAVFKNSELERVYYFEQPKNDGYPVVQLARNERYLKGFKWQGERRPADRNAVTPLSLRPSQRIQYSSRQRASYKQTEIYFPGYMGDIYRQIQVRDSLRAVRERERKIAEAEAAEQMRRDSIARADSIALADSLFRLDSIATADSLKLVAEALEKAKADSLAMVQDSIAKADSIASIGKILTPEEFKAKEKEEKERKRAEKKANREAERKRRKEEKEKRWEELDKRDAEKAAQKEERRLEKLRKKKRKYIRETAEQERKEAELLEKYRKQYEEQAKKKGRKNKDRPKEGLSE